MGCQASTLLCTLARCIINEAPCPAGFLLLCVAPTRAFAFNQSCRPQHHHQQQQQLSRAGGILLLEIGASSHVDRQAEGIMTGMATAYATALMLAIGAAVAGLTFTSLQAVYPVALHASSNAARAHTAHVSVSLHLRNDHWSCVAMPDPPRMVVANTPFSGTGALSEALAHRADSNEFRHVVPVHNDTSRFEIHNFDERVVAAAVAMNSFRPGGAAVTSVVQATPQLLQDGDLAASIAYRLSAVRTRGLESSPALVYESTTPLVDYTAFNHLNPVVVTMLREPIARFAAAVRSYSIRPLYGCRSG